MTVSQMSLTEMTGSIAALLWFWSAWPKIPHQFLVESSVFVDRRTHWWIAG
jgi:hypothetical protein